MLHTIVDEQEVEHDIVRDNMPFGSVGVGEFGTYFIGYARTPAVTEFMLQRMFVGNPPANYDRILDFSTAITGTLFFVPTADFLDDPPERRGVSIDSSHSCADRGIRPPIVGGKDLASPRRPVATPERSKEASNWWNDLSNL